MKYKQFTTEKEVTEFINTYYWNFVQNHFTKLQRDNIVSVESAGRTDYEYLNNSKHLLNVFNDVMCCFDDIPEVPFDIIAYRSGDMLLRDGHEKRSFYCVSLLKTIVDEKYATEERPTTILHIKQGSKIIPLQAFNDMCYVGDAELLVWVPNVKKKGCLFPKYVYDKT